MSDTPPPSDGLDKLLNTYVEACKTVENDGASYRHMPDYYKAKADIEAFLEAERLRARVDEVNRISIGSTPEIRKAYIENRIKELQAQAGGGEDKS